MTRAKNDRIGHAVALYRDQWKDRDEASQAKARGDDAESQKLRAAAGEDRKRMKRLDPNWKHAKYSTGEKEKIKEDFISEDDMIGAGQQNQGERNIANGKSQSKKGKKIDNSPHITLMPKLGESISLSTPMPSSHSKLLEKSEDKRDKVRDAVEKLRSKKSDKEVSSCDEEKVTLDSAGMPITERVRARRNVNAAGNRTADAPNNATGPTLDMICPPRDENGEPGVANPKGKPKRPRGGDPRPNAEGGPELPYYDGTVPTGAGL